jgi:hypothetical protein
MMHHHRRGATGTSGAMTLDQDAPTAAAAAPMVTATIPVGSGPVGVAVNLLTGAVYTANIGDDTVSVISG